MDEMTNERAPTQAGEEVYICPTTGAECKYQLPCVMFHCASDRSKKAQLAPSTLKGNGERI
jgi:hypothetical protein